VATYLLFVGFGHELLFMEAKGSDRIVQPARREGGRERSERME